MKAPCRAAFCIVFCLLTLQGLIGLALATDDSEVPSLVQADLIRGTELLYNRSFQQAETQYLKVIATAPEHPSGYFYLAMVNWSQLAAGFWTEEVLDRYEERIGRTIDVAQKAVDRDAKDAAAHFYLGGALGFKARFYLMQERYFASFLLALRAVDALRKCRDMDPENRDVLFGLGVFEYYTAKMSGILRFLSTFLIHPADREAGLEKLRTAAAQGTVTRIEARSMLLHIYLFMEDLPGEALPLAERLTREFPDNPRFAYLLGAAQLRMGRDPLDTAALMRERRDHAATPAARLLWEHREAYLRATEELLKGRLDLAETTLRSILPRVDPQNDPFMAAFPLVKLGMCRDLAGDRKAALALYSRVRDMENGAGAQYLSRKYEEEPIGRDDPFLLY